MISVEEKIISVEGNKKKFVYQLTSKLLFFVGLVSLHFHNNLIEFYSYLPSALKLDIENLSAGKRLYCEYSSSA